MTYLAEIERTGLITGVITVVRRSWTVRRPIAAPYKSRILLYYCIV